MKKNLTFSGRSLKGDTKLASPAVHLSSSPVPATANTKEKGCEGESRYKSTIATDWYSKTNRGGDGSGECDALTREPITICLLEERRFVCSIHSFLRAQKLINGDGK